MSNDGRHPDMGDPDAVVLGQHRAQQMLDEKKRKEEAAKDPHSIPHRDGRYCLTWVQWGPCRCADPVALYLELDKVKRERNLFEQQRDQFKKALDEVRGARTQDAVQAIEKALHDYDRVHTQVRVALDGAGVPDLAPSSETGRQRVIPTAERVQILIAERNELRTQNESMRGAIERVQQERDDIAVELNSRTNRLRKEVDEVRRERDRVSMDLLTADQRTAKWRVRYLAATFGRSVAEQLIRPHDNHCALCSHPIHLLDVEEKKEPLDADSTNRLSMLLGSPGAVRVLNERLRQVYAEGWTPEHDDKNVRQEMAWAAICYAAPHDVVRLVEGADRYSDEYVDPWPWSKEWDKRGKHGPLRKLEIAGALIVAELDRLIRAEQRETVLSTTAGSDNNQGGEKP